MSQLLGADNGTIRNQLPDHLVKLLHLSKLLDFCKGSQQHTLALLKSTDLLVLMEHGFHSIQTAGTAF